MSTSPVTTGANACGGRLPAFFSLVLACGLTAAPFAARDAAAQRPASIQAVCTVTEPNVVFRLPADTAGLAAAWDVRQVRIPGFGVVAVQSGPGTMLRVLARESPGLQVIRVTVDYLGG